MEKEDVVPPWCSNVRAMIHRHETSRARLSSLKARPSRDFDNRIRVDFDNRRVIFHAHETLNKRSRKDSQKRLSHILATALPNWKLRATKITMCALNIADVLTSYASRWPFIINSMNYFYRYHRIFSYHTRQNVMPTLTFHIKDHVG